MDSTRVALLKGVIEESHGRLDEAQSLYEKLLEKEPSNLLVNKRRLACIKTKPEGVTRATEGLAELVDIYPTDHECWLELASLYLSQNKYSQAAYALEELVLLAPHNVFYILKYAETLYTNGRYCQSLQNVSAHPRARRRQPRTIERANGRSCARSMGARTLGSEDGMSSLSRRPTNYNYNSAPPNCLVTRH